MLRPGAILILFTAVTVLSFAAMHLWSAPLIRAEAQGLALFDLRMDGYGVAEVREFLARISPEGREMYLGRQRVLDTIFPMALTGTLGLSGFILALRYGWIAALILGLAPLVYFTFDMLENAQVAALLRAGVVSDTMAEAASGYTVAKAASLRSMVALLLLLLAARAGTRAWGREG